jgi:glycine reductase
LSKKIVHYINQFYAGIGGEEKADHKPEKRDGAVGPGMALSKELGDAGIQRSSGDDSQL